MYLSNKDILKEIKKGNLTISEFNEKYLGQASYDLALSNEFWIPLKVRETIDVRESTNPNKYMKKVTSKYLVLKPGEMCHALTKEKITLSNGLIGILGGRSRFARLGVTVHVTSAVVQPGSDNRQILEIVNLSPFVLKLYEGVRFSQIFFERLETKTDKPYKKFGRIAIKQ
jgi:dCTP deaminase